MKTAALLMASACSCLAAIGNFSVLGTTATQALIQYTAPDGNACTIQLSQNNTYAPPALDVDPGTFANSNSDLSRPSTVTDSLTRTLVLGQRASQLATAGTYSGIRHFSRALQAFTPYFGQITCPSTGDTLPFSLTTANIPLGQTYGDPWLSDPAHPGEQPWPEWVGGLAAESFIDPLMGTLQYRVGPRGNQPQVWNLLFGTAFDQGQTISCDSAGPWSNPCGVVSGGSGGTTVGNSQSVLVLRPQISHNNPWGTNYGQFFTIDQLGLSLTGNINSANSSYRNMSLCFSMNSGNACASQAQTLAMSQASSTVTFGDAPVNTSAATVFGVDTWVLDTTPRINVEEMATHSGTATVTNNSGTYSVAYVSGDLFSLYWAGGNIRLSTNNDACTTAPASTTSVEYPIASYTDGNTIVLGSGTPPTGTVYWCANNFAVMLWRSVAPTDGSTVTLTAAKLNALGSGVPAYPDNGTANCFNRQVFGGFYCLYGGLFWVNPSGPSVVWYGTPQGTGNGITNDWVYTYAPTSESASIDQTQTNLTFYMISYDPARTTPLILRGVLTPSTTPTQLTAPQAPVGSAQIGNLSITATDAYSVTWSNSAFSLTFTNLTPETSMAEGVFQQMATFDPKFNSSYYRNLDCGTEGQTSQGVLFFDCLATQQDGPGTIFAFSPGDGNPAHAGQVGGPQIIGSIDSYNTPRDSGPSSASQGALTGHGVHAIGTTGETGWINISGQGYVPINTSATTIPASSANCSSFTGLSGLSGQCIALVINSYTHASVTGYEPYFASPVSPFLGTPGELRTTQTGDTFCVAVSSATSCNWTGSNELMTLVQKNSGGNWVAQRGTFGQEVSIPTGPITLWWQSYESLIPPGSVNVQQVIQVYWNPTAGCGGSPDPHGNCLLMDQNESNNHGEWINGGVALATNVPAWGEPIWGWPFVYLTEIGSVPATLSYPFANDTPYQANGVNFVAEEPPFAGVFGHPWGSDSGSHSNPPGANASAYEKLRAFDNLPVGGGQNEPTFTHVTGQLYSATPTSNVDADDIFGYQGSGAGCNTGTASSGCVAINRKLMATAMSCGSHPVIDISGPSSSILTTSSGSYTGCITRVGGECRAGSSVGEIFMNCPGVVWNYCTGVSTHGETPLGVGNDMCVGNIGNGANAVIQYTLDKTDYAGVTRRALVSATARLRMVFGFENNQLLPDNSWILYRQESLNYQRPEMWMAKLPPYPAADSVARGTFVPWPVTIKPPAGLGVNNAVVKFGYQEYGAPQLINCTTRNDACMAVSTAITVPPGNQPFYFASENPAGAPCATGCTITIPAISQRVLYYQIQYRSASNTVLSAGTTLAVVVP